MRRRKAKENEKIYLVKVIQSDWTGRTRGQPYRILAIQEELSLYSFAEAIVSSFSFDFDHAFGFYDNLKQWTKSEECYELFEDMPEEIIIEPRRCKSVKKTKVKAVFSDVKKRMLFLYDYGDEWYFIVELQKIETPREDSKYPLLVESVGKAFAQYE
ncbi:MAG: IS1096 element passenger TnpR family protein [Candidatus Methanospirareceae archaeon]